MMSQEKHVARPTSAMLRPKQQMRYMKEVLCMLTATTILAQIFFVYQYSSNGALAAHAQGSANSTLGFGSIYAVSRRNSPRQSALLNAASLTGFEINIPNQPAWTEANITSIKAPVNSSLDKGSALAWLGHRNALETFLESIDETALIVEDDIDWDVRLRQDQIPQTAYAIRELLGSHSEGYYGSMNSWDLIWLGHCGDYFDASQGSDLSVVKSYHDSAMPDFVNLHPWTRNFLNEIGATQNKQRLVHKSVSPLCTFAYAITRVAAKRVLNEIAVSEPTRGSERPCKAYDVRLLEGCRDEGLKCITVNPELFHHSPTSSEIAQISDHEHSTRVEEAQELVELPTSNIRCSARSWKWKEIEESLSDTYIDAARFIKDLAEHSPHCYIDDL